jgi:hypothetical protein
MAVLGLLGVIVSSVVFRTQPASPAVMSDV